jgi:hypothetical protein
MTPLRARPTLSQRAAIRALLREYGVKRCLRAAIRAYRPRIGWFGLRNPERTPN